MVGTDNSGDSEANSIFEQCLEFVEALPERTADSFQGLRLVYGVVLGMLYNAAQRLIDAKQRGGEPNPLDESLILVCNRLFNECFTGYVVLSHGMLGAGIMHLRAALEITELGLFLLVDPRQAERWLGGREYSPGEVRKLLDASDEGRAWYGYLSKLSHANVAASSTTVYGDAQWSMIFYGGHRAPRTAAATGVAYLWLALTFLRLFYGRNEDRLAELGLLVEGRHPRTGREQRLHLGSVPSGDSRAYSVRPRRDPGAS